MHTRKLDPNQTSHCDGDVAHLSLLDTGAAEARGRARYLLVPMLGQAHTDRRPSTRFVRDPMTADGRGLGRSRPPTPWLRPTRQRSRRGNEGLQKLRPPSRGCPPLAGVQTCACVRRGVEPGFRGTFPGRHRPFSPPFQPHSFEAAAARTDGPDYRRRGGDVGSRGGACDVDVGGGLGDDRVADNCLVID
jgi:hypothetical protein